MIMSLVLFENEFLNIVAISFTALVINELIMVALEITTWYGQSLRHHHLYRLLTYPCRHIYMVISEIATLLIYVISMAFLPEYFGALLSQWRRAYIRVLIGSNRSLIRRQCSISVEVRRHRSSQRSAIIYWEDDSA
jgi:hypothetical protein